MRVIFFPTQPEAEAFELVCRARAQALGQSAMSRWSEIIVAQKGFGVAIEERVLTDADRPLVVEWTPPRSK